MRKRHLRILVICGVILAVLGGVYFIGSGFNVREDVVLIDYAAPPDENEMTITVGVASSAGYTRTYKNASDNPKVIKLQFYSAFGGVNGHHWRRPQVRDRRATGVRRDLLLSVWYI